MALPKLSERLRNVFRTRTLTNVLLPAIQFELYMHNSKQDEALKTSQSIDAFLENLMGNSTDIQSKLDDLKSVLDSIEANQ